MTTYQQAGVDISMGDRCSALAYNTAKKTFASRKGMIGAPVNLEGGFTGALDFGDYYMVFNCDGVGSKMLVGEAVGKFDTLGYDLVAMVADDAVCVGAETTAIVNTIDTHKISEKIVAPLMQGLGKACIEQRIVIPGGEIGEMPDLVKGNLWNASAIGVVEKKKFLSGHDVRPGDAIIGLRSRGFRSNGFALVRHVLKEKFGPEWAKKKFAMGAGAKGFKGSKSLAGAKGAKKSANSTSSVLLRKYDGKSWGEVVLTPSIIYSGALLELLGRFRQKRHAKIKALAHVTGGGIPGNISRVLGKYGAELYELWPAHQPMLRLQELGNVSDREAYEVWNMGTGMIVISNDFKKIARTMENYGIEAQIIGEVIREPGVRIISHGFFEKGKMLEFEA